MTTEEAIKYYAHEQDYNLYNATNGWVLSDNKGSGDIKVILGNVEEGGLCPDRDDNVMTALGRIIDYSMELIDENIERPDTNPNCPVGYRIKTYVEPLFADDYKV